MKEFYAKYMNKNISIMVMVASIFVVCLFLLSINWNSNLNFMQNLSYGYIFSFNFESGSEQKTYLQLLESSSKTDDIIIYFKYAVILPMTSFMVGLWGYLTTES